MLIILPTWVNLLLKAYAFIGIFSVHGSVNHFFDFIGIGPKQILFTDFSFLFVATYIEIPFMIMPYLFRPDPDKIKEMIHAAVHTENPNKCVSFKQQIHPCRQNNQHQP